MDIFSFMRKEKQGIALATASFYFEVEREIGLFMGKLGLQMV